MDKTIIIGNLTRNPEIQVTRNGKTVCRFSVAVNERRPDGQTAAKYYNVSVWGEQGANCARYLSKGRKVCAVGRVSASAYTGNDGNPRASLELSAYEVEFLTSKSEGNTGNGEGGAPQMTPCPEIGPDELPF